MEGVVDMRSGKKVIAMLMMISLVFGFSHIESLAAKKITSISLKITSNIVVGSTIDPGAVEVTTKNSRYGVDEYEFTNNGFSWAADDVPELEIELSADDDYYFSLKAGDVKVSGANYISARTKDSARILVVTVKLPSLAEQTGAIENTYWTGSTIAGWDAAIGAGSYEVKLFKDGQSVGGTKETTSTSLQFSNEMASAGSYSFQVRPVNQLKADNKGEWKQGPSLYIDEAVAEQLKNGGAAWHQDQTGWWYRNLDGSYCTNGWFLIGDKWYYFDEAGYMKSGWITWNGAEYYCDPVSGEMWVNREAPDGSHLSASGAKIDAETWQRQQEEAQRLADENISWDDWNSQWNDGKED